MNCKSFEKAGAGRNSDNILFLTFCKIQVEREAILIIDWVTEKYW